MIKSFNSCSVVYSRPHTMRGRLFVVFALALAAAALSPITSSAQAIEMTKIVCRFAGPGIAPDTFIAKPITIYKAGEKYSRLEYAPDLANGAHMMGITREPDAWIINRANNTAEHALDPGPSFIARNPILGLPRPGVRPDMDEFFKDLEFGNEGMFFQKNRGRELGPQKIEGKDAKGFALKNGSREVTLFVDPQTEKPVQIDFVKDGKPEFSVRYLSYETGLGFDPALFEIPEGLKVIERKGQ